MSNDVATGAFFVALVCLATSGYLLHGLGGFFGVMGAVALVVSISASNGGETQ